MDFQIIGHRGSGSGRRPHGLQENSLKSFERAIRDGADEVECDLALTKDERIILFHDPHVRLSGKRRQISDLTRVELLRAAPLIPDLQSMLDLFTPDRLLLELKSHTDWRRLLDSIGANVNHPERLRFISFESDALKDIKRRWPDAYCNFIATSNESRFEPVARRKHVDLCRSEGFEEISGHYLVFPKRICDAAFDAGLSVGLGMVDGDYPLSRCLRRGVRRLYTNRVAWLKSRVALL